MQVKTWASDNRNYPKRRIKNKKSTKQKYRPSTKTTRSVKKEKHTNERSVKGVLRDLEFYKNSKYRSL